jgi:hypothetical protein
MAQNFVGSNNVNLLIPNGQFGTRLQGGKDSASERYIFTLLNKITRNIFQQTDDNVLEYLNDDGLSVEPIYYAPIIPMILVNGSKGIGTGFSTDIMCYNPSQIIDYLENKLSFPVLRVSKGNIRDDLIKNLSQESKRFASIPKGTPSLRDLAQKGTSGFGNPSVEIQEKIDNKKIQLKSEIQKQMMSGDNAYDIKKIYQN